jgi:hypothetical protein
MFLRGAGGLAVPLPVLECLVDGRGAAFAAGGALPNRFVVCFGGYSAKCDPDNGPDIQTPTAVGPNYDLKRALAPLGGFGNVRASIAVVSGVKIPSGPVGKIPAGGFAYDPFHWHGNALLAGMRQVSELGTEGTSSNNEKRYNSQITGPTSDQVVADAWAGATPIRSLAYKIQASVYITSGKVEMQATRGILYRRNAAGDIVPVSPAVSPRAAYQSLLTGIAEPDAQAARRKMAELQDRKSVLDLVDRRLAGLVPRLGRADQRRLAAHLEEIRALETRIAALAAAPGPACKPIPDPGQDPPVGGSVGDPFGYDTNRGYSNEEARARIFCDLIALAFTCDLTRVATLLFTMFQTFMNIGPITGHNWNAHQLQHQGKNTAIADFIAWHMKHFGYLVAKLRDTPEGAGSLLDRTALVFLPEGGTTGSSHNATNMSLLVAGRAGGLKAGHHLVAPPGANHPAQVLVTAMNAVGVPATQLGEVSGTVPGLRG